MFISAITGFALQASIAFASATKVRSGIITSSFSLIPNAFSERCNAAVQLETATAYLDFEYLPKSASNVNNIGNYQNRNTREVAQQCARNSGDLLKPFKNNPYTHPMGSVA